MKLYDLDKIAKIEEIQRECAKLNIPSPPLVTLEAKVEREGKIVEHFRKKSDSFVRNAYNILVSNLLFPPELSNIYQPLYADGYITVKYYDGQVEVPLNYSNNFRKLNVMPALVIERSSGVSVGVLHVGTNTTPDTLDDYMITSPIALSTVKNVEFTPARKFRNIMSGSRSFTSALNVGEVGYYAAVSTSDNSAKEALIFRDVFNPALSVQEGDTLTITYVIEVQFP